ncbi:MAG: DUF2922 domain-containing protein [Bacillota bacterium]|nr:DUF2922 domain-containing protein [Bacillota bacterium]
MAKSVVMNFLNEQGKKVSITVNNAKDTLTAADVSAVMDTIVAKNIFHISGGDIKTKDSAQIVDKTSTSLSVK